MLGHGGHGHAAGELASQRLCSLLATRTRVIMPPALQSCPTAGLVLNALLELVAAMQLGTGCWQNNPQCQQNWANACASWYGLCRLSAGWLGALHG